MKFAATFGVLALSVLAGCASTTPAELRTTAGKNFQATVNAPVSAAYRQMVTRARECFVSSIFRIDADYFPDVQEGNLTISAVFDAANTHAMVTAKLSPVDGGKTLINAHYFRVKSGNEDGYRWTAQSLADWAEGKPGVCKL